MDLGEKMGNKIDFAKTKEIPNKYNLTPDSIKSLKVLDWERLKEECWWNPAINAWVYIGGVGWIEQYGYNSEFIFIIKSNGYINFKVTSCMGMCKYLFSEFYKEDEIFAQNDFDIQAKILEWFNRLIDEGILGV